MGVMGFSDMLEQLGMAYDSEHAWDFADKIFEFVSYVAIDESANLAAERGSYSHLEGSGWSKGMVPIDTIKRLEADRGAELTVSKSSKYRGLNWDALRAKVKNGMRNATLMAVAPNANIGLVAGTTPGFDPRFAQVFSRNKISGKYLDLNHNLVNDLKNMGIWDKVKDSIIAEQGDLVNISGIPQHIKDIYKTSFSTSPYAFIEVAARAQKWVDQALSRNMYLETRDIGETMDIYSTAWKKGVKTTYYLHMKPRHTAEQSTVHVNKGEAMGKKGFAAVMHEIAEVSTAPAEEAVAAMAVAKTVASVVAASASAAAPADEPREVRTETLQPKVVGFAQVTGMNAVAMTPIIAQQAVQTQTKPVITTPTVVTVQKKPNIMPPSDPSEETICDSCA
jgi:ribonucleoside-diphosphate reductase alpha chain